MLAHPDVDRLCRISRLVDAVPAAGDLLRAGHIGSSQVNELARAFAHPRAGNRLAEFAPVLLEHAEHLRFAEREFDRDATLRRAEHGEMADASPLPRTVQQRAHDAVEAIFRAAASMPADSRAPEPVVNIGVDASTFDDALRAQCLAEDSSLQSVELGRQIVSDAADLIDRRCETAGGVAIAPDAMLRAALTGHVRRVVTDAAGTVVDLGRAQRLLTGSSRTAARLLVRNCSHPGCRIPATLCDVDHVHEWGRDGGRTDQVNAAALCGSHNRHQHRTRWSLKRATSKRMYTVRDDGTVVLPVGEREPEWFDDEDDPVEIARIDRHIRRRLEALVPS
jgi:hypothetical protein